MAPRASLATLASLHNKATPKPKTKVAKPGATAQFNLLLDDDDDYTSVSTDSSDDEEGVNSAKFFDNINSTQNVNVKSNGVKAKSLETTGKREPRRSGSEDESSAEEEGSDESENPKKETSSSEESSEESDSESESSDSGDEEEPQANPIADLAKAGVEDEDESSSEEESDQESDEEAVPSAEKPAMETNLQNNGTKAQTSTEIESGSEGESDNKPEAQQDAESESESSNSDAVVARPSVLPLSLQGTGFQVGPLIDSDSADVSKMLAVAKASGQQLWYFTAPESLPITVIEQMVYNTKKAKNGKAVVTHEGSSYSMRFDPPGVSREIKLVVPKSNGYVQGPSIDQVMHLEQVVNLDAQPVQPGPAREPRQQPSGLKNRNIPFGVPASKPSTDVEMADAVPVSNKKEKEKKRKSGTVIIEKLAEPAINSKKRKSSTVIIEKLAEPAINSKKRKHREESAEAPKPAGNAQPAYKSPSKKPKVSHVPLPIQSSFARASPDATTSLTANTAPMFSTQSTTASSNPTAKETPVLPPTTGRKAVKATPIVRSSQLVGSSQMDDTPSKKPKKEKSKSKVSPPAPTSETAKQETRVLPPPVTAAKSANQAKPATPASHKKPKTQSNKKSASYPTTMSLASGERRQTPVPLPEFPSKKL